MRNLIALAAAGSAALLLTVPALASDSMSSGSMSGPSKTVTVTGQVVDLACFLSTGAHGASHKACAKACAKAGGALGILTKDGDVLVSIEPSPGVDPNKLLIEHVEDTVTVTGTEYDAHGVKSIVITSVKAADAMSDHMSHM